MSDKHGIATNVLKKYTGFDNPVPELDPSEQTAILEHLRNADLVMFAGQISLSSEIYSVGALVSNLDLSGSLDRVPDALIGPHFFGDTYTPNAIGLWSHKIGTGAPAN